jgi:hypothetical protein
MMMKITDWDSHWTLNYDSLFIGKIVLDDGSIFDRGPLWVVQNYEQYSVISTQEIKKKKEIEDWNFPKNKLLQSYSLFKVICYVKIRYG